MKREEVVEKNVGLLREGTNESVSLGFAESHMTRVLGGKARVDFCYDPQTGEILELRNREKDKGAYGGNPSYEGREGIAHGCFYVNDLFGKDQEDLRILRSDLPDFGDESREILEATITAYNQSQDQD